MSSIEEILPLLPDEVGRVRKTPLYFVGLSLVALVMVLLPVIYVCLIVVVGYLTYLHATHDAGILHGAGVKAGLLLYVGPILAGTAVCFFMIKPLFARRARQAEPLSLERGEEPLLFAWVEKLSHAVRAPKPSRIDVNCEVNASASFRRGWLSLMGGDLVLTIGMPLVAGMTLRQFTGVLAHELGHFAQGGGMRLSYVIRSVNHWFARVVFERDAFDLALDRAGEQRTWWVIGLMIAMARGCVWLSRRILRGLMLFGHLISSFLLREMEYDADRYESRVAGSDEFARTVERLHALMIGHHLAMEKTGQLWTEKKLPDDLPALCLARAGKLEEESWRKYLDGVMEQKTSRWASHPCDRDRIASAARENAAGLLLTHFPATVLFRDFDALSRRASSAHYRALLGEEIDPGHLSATVDVLEAEMEEARRLEGVGRFLQGSMGESGPWYPEPVEPRAGTAEAEARRELEEIRAELLANRGTPFAKRRPLLDRRLGVALRVLDLRSDPQLPQAERMLALLRVIRDIESNANHLGRACEAAVDIVNRLQAEPQDQELHRDFGTALRNAHQSLTAIRSSLEAVPYPFDHVDGEISCAGYVVPSVPQPAEPGPLIDAAHRALELLGSLYKRTVARLVQVAEGAESAIGLEPMDRPPSGPIDPKT